jgi:uncharacterized membrane protein YfcA
MSALELVIVAVASAATATLTGVAGIGGGLILLVVFLQFMDPLVAIPLHGVIQLVSNSSRAVVLRHNLATDVILWSSILLLPGAFVGLRLAEAIPETLGRAAIAVFALASTWAPQLFRRFRRPEHPHRRFLAVGALSGLASPTLGATGPLIAPFFHAAIDNRLVLVGTLAVAQAMSHLAKVAVFGVDGFAFLDHTGLVAVGSVGVVAGTWFGTRLLHRADEATFQMLFRWAITLVSARLLIGAAWEALA